MVSVLSPRCLALAAVLVLVLRVSPMGQAAQASATLGPWTPGTLEIHQISTGLGNSALAIFPDGTSLLVDAGDLQQGPAPYVPRPDGSRRPGEWIARYVRRALAHDREPAIDYALMTHLHRDHIGAPGPRSRVGRGGYQVAGISEVAEHVPVRRILDRAWPDYAYPAPVPGIDHYRAFIDWSRQNAGLEPARFVPGRADQLSPLRAPARYPAFEVRNIAANGEVWTGTGAATRHTFPALADLVPDDHPTENSLSTVIRVSYGRFQYVTGGDLPGSPVPPGGPAWTDMESTIAPVVGPVDVLVLNHHGMFDATNAGFLRTLRPRVIVIPTYGLPQPDFGVVVRLLSPRLLAGPRDIFATGLLDATRGVLGELVQQFASTQGHVVLRVEPGGDTYRAYVLDDTVEGLVIKASHGPYQSR